MRRETVIQFDEDGFLRGFVDYFFQKLQDKRLFNGSVVIVQPIEKGICSVLEQQGCGYSLFLRGIDNEQVADEHTHIDIVSRCVNPYENLESCMKLAGNPGFRFIVSNTTEAGIKYVDSDQLTGAPVRSSPGKLTQPLYRRFRLGLEGFIILSCELIDHNGRELEKCCLRHADLWGLGERFKTWPAQENDFCSTLMDHIIIRFPRNEHEEFCRRIGGQDNIMDMAEIFHLWVIQGSYEDELPLQRAGFYVVWTNNMDPYKKRKVRIPNEAHTSMVLGTRLYGLKIVGGCLKDEEVSAPLRECIFGEIISTIGGTEDNRKFGEAVLERFSSPFIKHMLLSIALNSVSKSHIRVLPTIPECRDMFDSCPQGFTFSLVTLIAFYRTDDANDSQEIMGFMKTAPVRDILKREDYWGQDLSPLLGDVKEWYELVETEDVSKACDAVLSETG